MTQEIKFRNLHSLFESKKYSECIDYADDCLNRNLDAPIVWKILGSSFIQIGKIDAAIETFQNAKLKFTKDGDICFALGKLHQMQDRLYEASKYFNEACSLDPNDISKISENIQAFMALKDFDSAELALDSGLEKFPENHKLFGLQGILFHQTSRTMDAIKSFENALKLGPLDLKNCYNLARCYFSVGDLKNANELCSKALSLNAEYSNALCLYGQISEEMGKIDEARKYFGKALEIEPEHIDARIALAAIEYRYGNIEQWHNNIQIAKNFNHSNKTIDLLEKVSKDMGTNETSFEDLKADWKLEHLIVSALPVKNALLQFLYEKRSYDLTKLNDPSFGTAIGSDYNLFSDTSATIQTLQSDLLSLLRKIFNRDIFLYDSFYSIFKSGGGTKQHHHLTNLDKKHSMLIDRKYSLVYYVCKGDQSGANPGYLKLNNPADIYLPENGSIVIFPATREHSSFYEGSKDRILVGANFYII